MKSDRQLPKTKSYFTFLNKLCSYWSINSISWLIAIATVLIGAEAAKADTYTVTNTSDSGSGSLRDAVAQAEANPGPDTIEFSTSLAGQTITLTSKDSNIVGLSGKDCSGTSSYTPYGALQITESLIVDGSKAPGITIDGNWNGNNESTQGNRIFYVPSPDNRPAGSSDSAVVLSINDITLENGNAGPLGGGGDPDDPCSNGGNIYFDSIGGELNLYRVNIENGHANDGGGLNVEQGDLNIFNSTLSNNKTRDDGGAIDFSGGANAVLVNSTLALNEAGFGTNGGSNRGGAFRTDADGSTMNMTYVTVAYNTASGEGGFIENRGTLNIRNSLLVKNDSTTSTSTRTNDHCEIRSSGTINNLGNNWESVNNVGDAPDCPGFNTDIESNINLSTTLADNGGLTQTLALAPDYPAGSNLSSSVNGVILTSEADCPEGIGAVDQRYFFRAVSSTGVGCEPGAYELQDAADAPPTIDLDGADATATGNDFATDYFLGEAAVKVTSADTTATDDDLDTVISDLNAQPIQEATIRITNPIAGDLLTVNGFLPRGIILDTNRSNNTEIFLIGRAFWAEYEEALELIEFSTTSTDKSDRQIEFTVTDTTDLSNTDITNNTATTTIGIKERDYGDAPDTYGTDATAGNSSNGNGNEPIGASHIIDSNLFLGATVPDAETNGFVDGTDNNENATDDDDPLGTGTGNSDDEDDFTLPTLTEGDTSYTIPVANITATNTTGKTATLHAWIDFDGDGTFEEEEHDSVTVNNGTNGGNPAEALSWTGIAAGTAGNTYARFRLTTDSTINGSTPGGIASDGEVEDYQVAIASPPVANPPEFICDSTLYIVIGQSSRAGRPDAFSELNRIDRSVVPFDFVPIGSRINEYNYNALAYNPKDNYIYAIVESVEPNAGSPFQAGELLRIGSDGVPISLGIPKTLQDETIPYNPNAGTFLANGTYVVGRQTNPIYTIDLSTSPPTATDKGEVTGARFEDFAVNPYDTTPNRIYGIDDVTDTLVYFDVDSPGAGVTQVPNVEQTENHNHGSQFYDVSGNFFYRNGQANEMYRIIDGDLSDSIATDPGGSHDGASCFAVGLEKEVDAIDPVPAGKNVTYTYRIGNASDIPMTVTLTDDLRSVANYSGRPNDNESDTPVNGIYTGTINTPSGTATLSNSNQTLTIENINLAAQDFTTITAEVTIPRAANPETYYNQATVVLSQSGFASQVNSDYPPSVTYEDPTPLEVTEPSEPNLLLVKRITAINPGQSDEVEFNQFNEFIDDGTTNDDNDDNWPKPLKTYLRGAVNIPRDEVVVKPGDEIEYTIYFLSNGDEDATKVKICDLIPQHMTFVNNSYNGVGYGIALKKDTDFSTPNESPSNADDTDEATFFAPGIVPTANDSSETVLCRKPDPSDPNSTVPIVATDNINGVVVVEIETIPTATASGTSDDFYGFIRFRARVK